MKAWCRAMGWMPVVTMVLLAGCSGSSGPGIRYYILDQGNVARLPARPGLRLAIVDLQIPQYLERYQLVTRTAENRLDFSETHQWGDNLRKNLTRTLADNLSASLGTVDIGTPANRTASDPDYSIQVYITRFERDAEGVVRLSARWQVTESVENRSRVRSHDSHLVGTRTFQPGDYAGTVTAMGELFTTLSDLIAGSLTGATTGEGIADRHQGWLHRRVDRGGLDFRGKPDVCWRC